MKTVFLLLLSFCFGNSYSQMYNKTFVLKEGCYTGRNEITANTSTFWYIKKDSSFIYLFRSKDQKVKTIRMGKWHYVGDSLLSLQFYPLKSSILIDSKIDYYAETKGSADSVYFNISIKGPNCAYPGFCGLVFDNIKKDYDRFGIAVGYGFKGVDADTNGNVIFAIPKNIYFGSVGVTSTPEYYPITINTFPYNNYHTLTISLPLQDSTNDIDVSKFYDKPDTFRYRSNPSGKSLMVVDHDLVLNFITKDRTPFLTVLYEAKKRQPNLTGPIDELIEFLRKE